MKTVIVTTTFYKTMEELRFRLAHKTIRSAIAAGHIVVIVDDSPDKAVGDAFRGLGAQVFPQLHKGMGPGRREAFFHAHEVAVREGIFSIVWTEPEKVDFIRSVETVVKPVLDGDADIIIPSRSEASWETWPAFQKESEQQANAVYNDAFGLRGFDPMFGPVAFHRNMTKYFALETAGLQSVRDDYVQHYAPVIARFRGARDVASIEVDMTYPPEQKEQEEGALNEDMKTKRRSQLTTLTGAYKTLAEMFLQTNPT